ncbi:MAG: LemA family protein [Acidobacteria bacterium]|nr:MAG: LemA family protein [Acidobacteriota bacterium]
MGKILLVIGVIVLLLVIVVGIGAVGSYNRLVNLQEQVNSSWAQVDTVLQRRYDLIPNLVNTVKGYAKQEQQVLTEITRLRSQWGEAKTTAERAQAATGLEGALGRLMVVIENYPELKSNQNFLALQDELAGTENRIAVERRRFNQTVQTYNASLRRFPTNILAGILGFESHPYFEAGTAAREAPKVQF